MKTLGLLCLFFCAPLLIASTHKEFVYNDAALKKTGSYTLSNPSAASRPKNPGLLVYFHGSGSTRSYASGFESLDAVAQKLNLLALAVQAPNDNETWANHARGPRNQHELYVKNLLDKLLSSMPDINRDKILFVGVSAGATFLSGDFLPGFIRRYRGGAVLLCGGGGPISLDKFLFKPLAAGESKAFPLAYYIQQADFLYRQTVQGVEYWKTRKAQVTFEAPSGGSHCGFDIYREMERLGKMVLSSH